MKVFVTGATGFIGHAVATGMARAGHEVFGLARSAEKAKHLQAAEVTPVIGAMNEPESYRSAADRCQVLIHCAAERSANALETDRRTVEQLLDSAGASGQARLLIYTSGCWVVGNTGNDPADESTPLRPLALVAKRVDTERFVLERNSGRVRTIVLRPGCVYGGSGSLSAAWFESATKEGAARIVGDGSNRWPMVHLSDTAEAYRLAAESPFGGEVFHVSDRSRFTVMANARAASMAATGTAKVVTTPVEEAAKTMGPFAECLAADQHIDASKAARLLGWQPRHGGFMDGAHRYYAAWKASQ